MNRRRVFYVVAYNIRYSKWGRHVWKGRKERMEMDGGKGQKEMEGKGEGSALSVFTCYRRLSA